MSAPPQARSEGAREGSSTAHSDVIREALCSRIRSLGVSILAITRSAMQETEDLEAEYAAQQQRLAKPQPRGGLTRRPDTVRSKYARSHKAASVSPMATTPPKTADLMTSRHAAAPASAGGNMKKKHSGAPSRQIVNGTTPVRVTAAGNAKRPTLSSQSSSAPLERVSKGNGGAGPTCTHPGPAVSTTVSAICATAEKNFHRALAKRTPQDRWSLQAPRANSASSNVSADSGDGVRGRAEGGAHNGLEEWCRGAPLYDLSHAVITDKNSCPPEEELPQPAMGITPLSSRNGAADAMTSMKDCVAPTVVTIGGAVPLSARATVAESELLLDAKQLALNALQVYSDQHARAPASPISISTESPTGPSPQAADQPETSSVLSSPSPGPPPARSYYNVIYIHELIPGRTFAGDHSHDAGKGSACGQGCSDAGATSRPLNRSGGVSGTTKGKLLGCRFVVSSHVHAIYAVEREGGWRSEPLLGVGSEAVPDAVTPSSPMSGDAEPVKLRPCVPAQRVRSEEGSALRAESQSGTANHLTGVKDAALSVAGGHSDAAPCKETAPHCGREAVAPDAGADTRVLEHIESLEDWRRDRQAHVKDQIRRQRRPSLVRGQWPREYYCYGGTGATALQGGGEGVSASFSASSPRNPRSAAATPTNAEDAPVVTASSNADTAASDSQGDEARTATPVEMTDMGREANQEPHPRAQQCPHSLPSSRVIQARPRPRRETTAYSVLLQARRCSQPQTGGLNMATTGTGAALSYKPEHGSALLTPGDQSSQSSPKQISVTSMSTPTEAAVVSPPTSSPPNVLYPRLEVVVASTYNWMEWAYGGAARLASMAAVCSSQSESQLWLASQQREFGEEAEEPPQQEERCWNASSRRPPSFDIDIPINVRIT